MRPSFGQARQSGTPTTLDTVYVSRTAGRPRHEVAGPARDAGRLWLTADQPELFAYTAPGADGICAIERIDLPDVRIMIACIQVSGKLGKGI